MKKFTKIFLTMTLASAILCGCGSKSVSQISNEYETPKANSDISSDIPLSYTDGFASTIAVIGSDAVNSVGSDDLKSEAALLIDASTGEVLFQKNPHKKEYPASTTKVLTALCCVKYGELDQAKLVGDEVIINEGNVIMCDYRSGVDTISFDVALHGALMQSGNDAAAFMTRFAANSLSDFAEIMNKEAENLGATESHFVNPHGLFSDDHYTTAYDLYLIFNEAIKYDKIVNTLGCLKYENTFSRKTAYGDYVINVSYGNTNQYVTGALATPEGIKVIGGKAGYTEKARRSYVMLAEANGHRYIFVTMRCEDVNEMYHDLDYLLKLIPVTSTDKKYADNE